MTIGERIRKRRTELGLSVDYIAAKLNKKKFGGGGGSRTPFYSLINRRLICTLCSQCVMRK